MKLSKYMAIILTVLFFCTFNSFAQSTMLPPKIGDHCPDYLFKTIINSNLKTARISSFRGKYLILDFWGTWCGSCVEAIPREDSIQKKFGSKLQFLMISSEKPLVIQHFFDRANKSVKLSLPSASDESRRLIQLFKVRYVPHYVWIDTKGIIRAITGAEEVTEANIGKFLEVGKIDLPLKEDEQSVDFDNSVPLFMDTSLAKQVTLSSYKVVGPYIPGYPNIAGCPNFPKYLNRRIGATNATIALLYRLAYSDALKEPFIYHCFPFYRTIVNVKDSLRINPITMADWTNVKYKYGVCYDLIIPNPDTVLLFRTMKQDLDSLYGLKASVVKRNMPCLIIKIKEPGLLHTNGGKQMEENNQFSIKLVNEPLDNLCYDIYQAVWSNNVTAVINETAFASNIDVNINANLKDLAALNKELAKYGLTASHEERNIDVLLLTDR